MAQRRRRSTQVPQTPKTTRTEFSSESTQIRVRWGSNASRPPIELANVLSAVVQDNNVLVTFGRVLLPGELPLSPEARRKIAEEGIEPEPVARVLIPIVRLGEMLQQLTTLLNMPRQEPTRVSPEQGG
jgi:hypothetical protein